jgi:HTH-type transcriptional regulator/antitoxin HigA
MATTNQTFIPLEAIHPSELIKDEMRERGLKRNELAKRMGIQSSNLSRLINSKETITPQTAQRLEQALGIPAEMWLNLQAAYDRDVRLVLERDNQEAEYSAIERVIAEMVNLPLLLKQLAMDSYRFAQDRVKALYAQLNINSTDELLTLAAPAGQFKRSDKLATDDKNLRTWVLLAHKECLNKQTDMAYKEGNAVLAAYEIATLANRGDITEQKMSDILNRFGICYSVVQKIEKVPVDAYSAIMDNVPHIVTSHRRNNMDMLIFDVLHELKHVHSDLKNGESNLSCNEYTHLDPKEVEANRFAEDTLIPPDIWERILSVNSKSLNPYHVFHAVIKGAKEYGISESIASWRYKHETGCYAIRGHKSPGIK